MIIAFCGHSDYIGNKDDESKILKILDCKIVDECDFFIGLYGGFDRFCYGIVEKIKERYKNVKSVFVTPYNDNNYIENRAGKNGANFDLVLYPELEKFPRKYAISYRNRWVAEKADVIIAFVRKEYGGAYAMYKYAKNLGKEIYNIAE